MCVNLLNSELRKGTSEWSVGKINNGYSVKGEATLESCSEVCVLLGVILSVWSSGRDFPTSLPPVTVYASNHGQHDVDHLLVDIALEALVWRECGVCEPNSNPTYHVEISGKNNGMSLKES